jgi:hypothetical protein
MAYKTFKQPKRLFVTLPKRRSHFVLFHVYFTAQVEFGVGEILNKFLMIHDHKREEKRRKNVNSLSTRLS